jgi:hypothetical protein
LSEAEKLRRQKRSPADRSNTKVSGANLCCSAVRRSRLQSALRGPIARHSPTPILREIAMSIVENPHSAAPKPAPPESSTVVRAAIREQFIPLRQAELLEMLVRSADLSDLEAAAFRRFCRLLQSVFHCEYQAALEDLKNAYAPFDPDADTRPADPLSSQELQAHQDQLFRRFGWLLERGNFRRLSQDDIESALADCSQWGLNLSIDFQIFERLEVYCRGDVTGTRYHRSLKNRFRLQAIDVPIYQRLVLMFRLREGCAFSKFLDTQDIHIKLFKEIPKVDVDMLLPGTRVKMSLLDRAKILLPTLTGLSITVWKIVQTVLFAAVLGSYLVFLGLVGGTIGYGLRSFYGYLNTKQKYQLNLTQSLYYQNLDNNAGAIFRLLDEAEEQENREAMLAYFYLWRYAPPGGWPAEELDRQIESFLRERTGQEIDFEIGDALDKLARLEILESCPDGNWKALVVDPALEALERRWKVLGA